jgi:hypothetical protein
MRRLRRLLALTPLERRWLLRVLPIVVVVRLALWCIPYGRVRHLACRLVGPPHDTTVTPGTIARSVALVSRLVPRATCLTQAIVVEALLTQAGIDSRLRIGVARQPDGNRFEAHAWVEHKSRILIGEVPDMGRFALMPDVADRP